MPHAHPHSIDAARAAAERGELARFVAEFLASPGSDNAPLGAQLTDRYVHWRGPVQLPIDQLHRLAGPPGQPVLVTIHDEGWWRDDVEDLKEQVEEGWEPPPVVVTWQDGQLVLEDGNHRLEAMRRAEETEAWSIVGFEDEAEAEAFAREHVAG